MIPAIRAEVRKFFTTRLWWGMLIGVAVAAMAFSLLFAFLLTSKAVDGNPGLEALAADDVAIARAVFTSGIGVGYLLTLAIGVMTIGAEYRHKTITSTFLAEPNRVRVMLAKVITLLGVGALYGVVSVVLSVAPGALVLTAMGHHPFADSSIWRTLALALLILGLWALIGLGVGILIPNQVAALLISVGAAWIGLPIISALLGVVSWGKKVVPYFPNEATNAMLGVQGGFGGPNAGPTPLSWWAAALVLGAYAAIMATIGTLRTVRSDIS